METIFQENSFVPLMVIGTLIMLAFALTFVLFVSYSQKKILKEHMRNQKQAFEHQEELLHSNILAQEVEKKRIARDLHDAIGSKLNVIFLGVCRIKELSSQNKEIHVISNEMEGLINTTIDSTRHISHELLPPTLEEFGLIEAIKEMQYNFNQIGTFNIDFTLSKNEVSRIDKLIEVNLFRVLQELISNSIKHGKASKITIDLSIDEKELDLTYQDNGSGFDLAQINKKKGLGMKNIESRINIIKANHEYSTLEVTGMKLAISLSGEKWFTLN